MTLWVTKCTLIVDIREISNCTDQIDGLLIYNFYPREVVGRGGERQLQVGEDLNNR